MPLYYSPLDNYPVGSVYTSSVSTSPAILFGGTWTAIEGVFIVGKAASGTFATAGTTGGAETVTLTQANYGYKSYGIVGGGGATVGAHDHGSPSGNAETSHANLPPYKVFYQWERTA